MTATSLKAQIWAAASTYAPLVALLGSSPFRMYDQQLQQGTMYPAVTMQQISRPREYVVTGQMPTSWARIQFNIYSLTQDSESANQVAGALETFLTAFNAAGNRNVQAQPNYILADRDMGIAPTQPLTFQRMIDVKIFSNENL